MVPGNLVESQKHPTASYRSMSISLNFMKVFR